MRLALGLETRSIHYSLSTHPLKTEQHHLGVVDHHILTISLGMNYLSIASECSRRVQRACAASKGVSASDYLAACVLEHGVRFLSS